MCRCHEVFPKISTECCGIRLGCTDMMQPLLMQSDAKQFRYGDKTGASAAHVQCAALWHCGLGPRLLLLRHDPCFGPEAHAGGTCLKHCSQRLCGPSAKVMQGLDFQPGRTFTFGQVPKKSQGLRGRAALNSRPCLALGFWCIAQFVDAVGWRVPGARLCWVEGLLGLRLEKAPAPGQLGA